MLEESIKNSETVVYFSHDYYSNTEDKNDQLIEASKYAKLHKVNKFIAVTPIEFVNFHSGSILENPIKDLNETHNKVLYVNIKLIFYIIINNN